MPQPSRNQMRLPKNTTFKLRVTLANPANDKEHDVDISVKAASYRAAVEFAAKNALAKLPIKGFSSESPRTDKVHVITVAKRGPQKNYVIVAAYSSDPEDGDWSDVVPAVDEEDAEIQASFIMTYNQIEGLDVQPTLERLFYYIDDIHVTDISVRTFEDSEVIALLQSLATRRTPAAVARANQIVKDWVNEFGAPPAFQAKSLEKTQ